MMNELLQKKNNGFTLVETLVVYRKPLARRVVQKSLGR